MLNHLRKKLRETMKPCSTYSMLQNRQCWRLVVLAQFNETDFSQACVRFPQKTEKTIHNSVFKSKKNVSTVWIFVKTLKTFPILSFQRFELTTLFLKNGLHHFQGSLTYNKKIKKAILHILRDFPLLFTTINVIKSKNCQNILNV